MQSVLDSLCRCFGSTPLNQDILEGESLSLQHSQDHKHVPATPDMKRRTRSLALNDKQWDALFSSDPNPNSRSSSQQSQPPQHQLDSYQQRTPWDIGGDTPTSNEIAIEQAQAVAKAKLAANPSRVRMHKRKRSSSSSRDDIFRSKKQVEGADCSIDGGPCGPTSPNPLSRFLSNHPVIAQSLCFATPVKDSTDEPYEVPMDMQSAVSGNTLNTAEDTITSTLYYETTKLAGLSQRNPPMPLFNNFHVDARDDIHQIVASHSHSSARMAGLVREAGLEVVELLDDDDDDDEEEETPPSTPHRRPSPNRRRLNDGNANNNTNNNNRHEDDALPPPMTNVSSSDSSNRSEGR